MESTSLLGKLSGEDQHTICVWATEEYDALRTEFSAALSQADRIMHGFDPKIHMEIERMFEKKLRDLVERARHFRNFHNFLTEEQRLFLSSVFGNPYLQLSRLFHFDINEAYKGTSSAFPLDQRIANIEARYIKLLEERFQKEKGKQKQSRLPSLDDFSSDSEEDSDSWDDFYSTCVLKDPSSLMSSKNKERVITILTEKYSPEMLSNMIEWFPSQFQIAHNIIRNSIIPALCRDKPPKWIVFDILRDKRIDWKSQFSGAVKRIKPMVREFHKQMRALVDECNKKSAHKDDNALWMMLLKDEPSSSSSSLRSPEVSKKMDQVFKRAESELTASSSPRSESCRHHCRHWDCFNRLKCCTLCSRDNTGYDFCEEHKTEAVKSSPKSSAAPDLIINGRRVGRSTSLTQVAAALETALETSPTMNYSENSIFFKGIIADLEWRWIKTQLDRVKIEFPSEYDNVLRKVKQSFLSIAKTQHISIANIQIIVKFRHLGNSDCGEIGEVVNRYMEDVGLLMTKLMTKPFLNQSAENPPALLIDGRSVGRSTSLPLAAAALKTAMSVAPEAPPKPVVAESPPRQAAAEPEKMETVEAANKNECSVCMENQINTVLTPCGHVTVCEECGKKLELCPLCRSEIKQVIKCFLP